MTADFPFFPLLFWLPPEVGDLRALSLFSEDESLCLFPFLSFPREKATFYVGSVAPRTIGSGFFFLLLLMAPFGRGLAPPFDRDPLPFSFPPPQGEFDAVIGRRRQCGSAPFFPSPFSRTRRPEEDFFFFSEGGPFFFLGRPVFRQKTDVWDEFSRVRGRFPFCRR